MSAADNNTTRLFTGARIAIGTSAARFIAIAAAPESEAALTAQRLLGPAENYGGRIAFRWIAALSAVLAVIFGCLYVNDKIVTRR